MQSVVIGGNYKQTSFHGLHTVFEKMSNPVYCAEDYLWDMYLTYPINPFQGLLFFKLTLGSVTVRCILFIPTPLVLGSECVVTSSIL